MSKGFFFFLINIRLLLLLYIYIQFGIFLNVDITHIVMNNKTDTRLKFIFKAIVLILINSVAYIT